MPKSTISEIKANVEDINQMVLAGKSLEAFEKYYGENVTMVQASGETFQGKAACLVMEENWAKNVTEFRGAKCLNYTVAESQAPYVDVTVVAVWYLDFSTKDYTFTGTQMSVTNWKDGKVYYEMFFSPVEHVMLEEAPKN